MTTTLAETCVRCGHPKRPGRNPQHLDAPGCAQATGWAAVRAELAQEHDPRKDGYRLDVILDATLWDALLSLEGEDTAWDVWAERYLFSPRTHLLADTLQARALADHAAVLLRTLHQRCEASHGALASPNVEVHAALTRARARLMAVQVVGWSEQWALEDQIVDRCITLVKLLETPEVRT